MNHPDFDRLRGDGLAKVVAELPEGSRHQGTFWALNAAVEDDLPPAEIAKIVQAATGIGLDEAYVERTLNEAVQRSR